MELKSVQILSQLYQSDSQFRTSLHNNPVKALALWHIEDEPDAQTLANNNKWLAYSSQALCAVMAEGEPLNWDGPIPMPKGAK